MRCPTDAEGFPVPLEQLDLPPSELDLELEQSYDNHHRLWTRKNMGQLAVSQLLRGLEAFQTIQPVDVHQRYHQKYEPFKPIPYENMYRRAIRAYEQGELMRLGSAQHRRLCEIDPNLIARIEEEHQTIKD